MVENSMSSRSSLQAYASSHRSRAVFSSVSAVFFSVSKVILLLSSRSSCTVSANRSITAVRYPGKQRELLRKSRRDYAGDRRRKPGVTYRTASSRDLGLNPLRRRGIPCPEVADDPLRYDEALNLAGALVDLRHPRVPVVALHGMVLHVPLPAQDLDRLVGHLVRHGRGIKLGPRADLHVPEPLVLRPRRFVRQQTGRLELRLHVRELERHSLVLRYRLAERRPLSSVPARIPEGRFGYPKACAAIPIRPPASVPKAIPSPFPSSPSRSSSVTKTSSRSTSSVVAETTPIFSACLPKEIPSASMPTTKAVMPSGARAKRIMVPATRPLVTHCLWPEIRYPPETFSARVCIAAASEPASGSVRAKHPIFSPRARSGIQRAFCSSVPWAKIGSVPALVCTASVTPTPASARLISSISSTYERKSVPPPPYSSGTHKPMNPGPASFSNISVGKRSSRSRCAACGSTSRSANSAARSLTSCCAALRSKSIAPFFVQLATRNRRTLARSCARAVRRPRSVSRGGWAGTWDLPGPRAKPP